MQGKRGAYSALFVAPGMVGADRRFGACAGGLRPGKGLSRGMSPSMVAPPQKSFAGRVDSGFNLWQCDYVVSHR
jgi:hypothetical protein